MSEASEDDNTVEPSAELRQTFWLLVLIVDVAMLAVAVGVLVLVFEDMPFIGSGSLAIGLLGFAACYRRVRTLRKS